MATYGLTREILHFFFTFYLKQKNTEIIISEIFLKHNFPSIGNWKLSQIRQIIRYFFLKKCDKFNQLFCSFHNFSFLARKKKSDNDDDARASFAFIFIYFKIYKINGD